MLSALLKSLAEQDETPIVICDLNHTMVYLNPVAKAHYARYGGGELTGRSLMDCHPPKACEAIERVVEYFRADPSHNSVYTYHSDKDNKDVYMIALRNESGELIGYYEKHRYRSCETGQLYDMP